jgi:3-oxoacyl-[acyl-carrier-protein] synthase-3
LIQARLRAIATHLPERVLANGELAALYAGWSEDKIFDKTGIRERRIAAVHETAADLAYAAAGRLFVEQQVEPSSIDFLLFCTQAPDYFLPTSACVLQHRLGLRTGAGALDVNLGCSGFVYGLSLAKGLIETGQAKRVLLLTGDTYSKFIHPLDKSVRTLFGDGAAATLLEATDGDAAAIGPFVFGTDGSGAANLIVPTGGFREARTAESARETTDDSGNVRTRDNLYMNGAAIMTFTLGSVPRACAALEARSGVRMDDCDFVVLHQANAYLLETLRRKLKVPPERFVVHLEHCGNTVSSTIPVALEPLLRSGLHAGKRALLVGFGVGYSWAATHVTL